ncbi:acyltransferase family protein [Acinetobacter larvae]|uniref:Acyltransferase 3 domain-containing protein n=1 Tax=Acinetobacter larvae TaxID=1789224 RepID=A0A1B2M0L0_9GAMM|nr:acyltransferase family protein [Acinetobacter larvae]AOA58563.1 hypothetical protein BFG52_09495 [Acinetobacter larvae]
MRDQYLDACKGILIFLVVFGHFLERFMGWNFTESKFLLSAIYSLHMPAFIFISGLLFKDKQITFKVLYFLSLLVPFQLFYIGLDYALTGHWFTAWYSRPYWILWYLFAMLAWVILTPLLKKTPYPLAVALLLACAIGFSPINNYILSIGRIFTFLPFFVAGHLYGATIVQWLRTKSFLVLKGFIALMVIAVLCQYFSIRPAWLYGSFSYQQLAVTPVTGSVFRLMLLGLSSMGILAILSFTTGFIQVFARLGQKSLSVYLFHGLWIMCLTTLFKPALHPIYLLILCLGLSMMSCIIFQAEIFDKFLKKISYKVRH